MDTTGVRQPCIRLSFASACRQAGFMPSAYEWFSRDEFSSVLIFASNV